MLEYHIVSKGKLVFITKYEWFLCTRKLILRFDYDIAIACLIAKRKNVHKKLNI